MKAAVYSEYGGPEVLRIDEVDRPVARPNELLVRVLAAALNPVDWHFVRGLPYPIRMAGGGLRRPRPQRRVGCDYSGVVEALGPGVTEFHAGDAVFGLASGTVAGYVAAPAAL